jgi:hypothetical protein
MLWHMFGSTKPTVGSVAWSRGKALNLRWLPAGTEVKSVHGAIARS